MPVTYNGIKNKFPHLSDDIINQLVRVRARFLNQTEQRAFIKLYAEGMDCASICKELGVAFNSYRLTKQHDLKFAEKILLAVKTRTQLIEDTLVRWVTGKLRKTWTTKTPARDDKGNAILDSKGNPVLTVTKEVIEETEPNATLIMFYLKAHCPDVYGAKQVENTADMLPTEELKAKLSVLKLPTYLNDNKSRAN